MPLTLHIVNFQIKSHWARGVSETKITTFCRKIVNKEFEVFLSSCLMISFVENKHMQCQGYKKIQGPDEDFWDAEKLDLVRIRFFEMNFSSNFEDEATAKPFESAMVMENFGNTSIRCPGDFIVT